MTESIGKKAVKGTLWASVDRIGNMCLQFGINLVLARLLLPKDFGVIGMIEIFILVSQVLIDGGFASALIQKKQPTQRDYSTVFYLNLLIACSLYGIIFVAAPWVAKFYKLEIVCPVLRAIGLILIANALSIVQTNRLRKELQLRKLATANLIAYSVSGAAAVAGAYMGWGVWSLVLFQLGNNCLQAIILWIVTKWHPSRIFSRASVKELFGFGGYLLAAGLLQEICRNVQGIIIGRRFSATDMGYYSQAYKLDRISSYTLPNILVQVMFPVYSSMQDDDERLTSMLSLNTRLISFVIFPVMGMLILVAKPLIVFLYGDVWSACAPYFQILCVGGLFICLQNTNFFAVAAKGKSRALFYWSIYKWSFLLVCLLVGMLFSIYGLLWGMAVSNLNIFLVNALLAARHTGYKFLMQLRDILPILALSAACLVASGLLYMAVPAIPWPVMALIYIALYIGAARVMRMAAANEILALARRFLKKHSST